MALGLGLPLNSRLILLGQSSPTDPTQHLPYHVEPAEKIISSSPSLIPPQSRRRTEARQKAEEAFQLVSQGNLFSQDPDAHTVQGRAEWNEGTRQQEETTRKPGGGLRLRDSSPGSRRASLYPQISASSGNVFSFSLRTKERLTVWKRKSSSSPEGRVAPMSPPPLFARTQFSRGLQDSGMPSLTVHVWKWNFGGFLSQLKTV